jgi:hypothetical protein
MAAKDEDIGGVGQRAAGAVAANKLEIVEGYPGKEKKKEEKKKKGAVNQIQPPTDDGVVKDPKLYAKARAKQSMFSGSGRVITPGKDGNDRFQGRYQMGRFAGKTPEEADEIFERTYEKATPAQREVYAKKADPGAGMAPSERAKQLKLQRDKEAKENPVPQANAKDEKPAPGADFEKLTVSRPHNFNMDASGLATGPDGKINAIGDGSTKDGKWIAALGNDASPFAAMDANPYSQAAKDVAKNQALATENTAREKATAERTAQMKSQGQAAAVGLGVQPAPTVGPPAFVGPPASAMNPAPNVQPNVQPAAAAVTSAATPSAPPFVGPPAPAPAPDSKYDFEPGEGKELTGMVGGRKTYTKADTLYGAAKPPMAAPSLDAMRADYQARNQNVAAADRALPSSLRTPTAPTPAALPMRGPASQPAAVTAPRAIVKPNQDVMNQHASAMERQHAYGADPALAKETQGIFNNADVNTRNAIGGQVALRAQGIDKPAIQKPQPVSQRVVAQRPATPEELRTGKARI